jgi:hypothetical protein
MTIELDHTIVPSHHKVASAKLLAELLSVPWAPTALGPFAPVFVNDGLTLDFVDTDEDFPIYHFCFRVGETNSMPSSAASRPPASPFAARCAGRWTCRSAPTSAAVASTGTNPTATSGRC